MLCMQYLLIGIKCWFMYQCAAFFNILLQWFEEKALQVETFDTQLRKLHANLESLVTSRRGLLIIIIIIIIIIIFNNNNILATSSHCKFLVGLNRPLFV